MTDGDALAGRTGADPTVVDEPSSAAVLVYSTIAPELHRFILGVVRDPSLADDVLQATFLKAVERGQEARAETARGWLFRVAYNEALVARRAEASRDRKHKRLASFRSKEGSSPDENLIRLDTIKTVRLALDHLSDDQRRVVQARVYEEKTFAEIAREMGLPLGTVLTRMRRALDKMRRSMNPGD